MNPKWLLLPGKLDNFIVLAPPGVGVSPEVPATD
jgi:hypothetical protein